MLGSIRDCKAQVERADRTARAALIVRLRQELW
jgi:hypothetical protein